MIWLEFIHVINVHLAAFECHSKFSDVIIAQILSVTTSTLTILTLTERVYGQSHVSIPCPFGKYPDDDIGKAVSVFYPDDFHD